MNVSLPLKAFLYVAGPTMLEIFEDMVSSKITTENLAAVKVRLYKFVAELTGKTSFTWDDDLCKTIMDVLGRPAMYARWGDTLLDIAEDWAKSSETKWDDVALLPVIAIFRSVAGIPDGKD